MSIRFPPQLVRFLRPYGLPFAALVLGGILSTFSEGVGIGLLIPFLDLVFQTNPDATSGGWFTRILTASPTQSSPTTAPSFSAV